MTKTIDFRHVIVLNEKKRPIIVPPEIELSDLSFLDDVQKEFERYKLPIEFEVVNVEEQEKLPIQSLLKVWHPSSKLRFLNVLIGLQRMGALAYAERKMILVVPDLPPVLSHNSPELPPRLYSNSPDLPIKQQIIDNNWNSSNFNFKNEAHKHRLFMMESRRRERMELIKKRQTEIDLALRGWMAEASEIISGLGKDSLIIYLKDSIDLVIDSIITNLEAHGAKSKEVGEESRKQEELLEAVENIRKKF